MTVFDGKGWPRSRDRDLSPDSRLDNSCFWIVALCGKSNCISTTRKGNQDLKILALDEHN